MSVLFTSNGPERHKEMTYLDAPGVNRIRKWFGACLNWPALRRIFKPPFPKIKSKETEVNIFKAFTILRGLYWHVLPPTDIHFLFFIFGPNWLNLVLFQLYSSIYRFLQIIQDAGSVSLCWASSYRNCLSERTHKCFKLMRVETSL